MAWTWNDELQAIRISMSSLSESKKQIGIILCKFTWKYVSIFSVCSHRVVYKLHQLIAVVFYSLFCYSFYGFP